ncbi:MAG: hypothetical protein Rpha_2097 [Candidatus Ruthia sp. Apha_13_S6]|nr:hypothetical protein [Candidatus Ruthia sp. Apha_13_S6]
MLMLIVGCRKNYFYKIMAGLFNKHTVKSIYFSAWEDNFTSVTH